MLLVPAIRQPDDVSCLPTCVRAVLAFRGRRISEDEASALCRAYVWGAVVDLALDGLADAGLDAELQQFDSVEDLQEPVECWIARHRSALSSRRPLSRCRSVRH